MLISVNYITDHRSPSEHSISLNDDFEWAKPVATELLVIRMNPYASINCLYCPKYCLIQCLT